MIEETNGPNDPTLLKDSDLSILRFLASTEVGWVADDLLGFDGLFPRTDTDKLAIFVSHNLVDRFIEHVCAAVNCRETCKGLRELSQSIEGVDVGRLAVASHGRGVHNDTVIGGPGGFGDVAKRNVRRGIRDG